MGLRIVSWQGAGISPGRRDDRGTIARERGPAPVACRAAHDSPTRPVRPRWSSAATRSARFRRRSSRTPITTVSFAAPALETAAISALALAVAQAEAIRAQLAAIVESSDDAVIGMTLDGEIVSWNRGAERIYGYTAEEALGCQDLVPVSARSRGRGPGDPRPRASRRARRSLRDRPPTPGRERDRRVAHGFAGSGRFRRGDRRIDGRSRCDRAQAGGCEVPRSVGLSSRRTHVGDRR